MLQRLFLRWLREAMAEEMKGRIIGDDHPEASVDGAYFGGYVKPANLKEDRKNCRLWQNKSGKRQVVVVVREHGGQSLPASFCFSAKRYTNRFNSTARVIRFRIFEGGRKIGRTCGYVEIRHYQRMKRHPGRSQRARRLYLSSKDAAVILC